MGPTWSDAALRRAYAAAIGLLFLGLALWRIDLVASAAAVSVRAVAAGKSWRLAGECSLFAGILSATGWLLTLRPRPRHDVVVLAVAAATGWAAEAWGTRLGVWRYYTGERPPLWIVPAWSLGAALIERVSAGARERWGELPAGAYWFLALACAAGCAGFTVPWLGRPAGWAGLAAVCASLAVGARPREEAWLLACGVPCVFLADLWGTTNFCWSYPGLTSPGNYWRGIALGMLFDSALVVGCLRLARRLVP